MSVSTNVIKIRRFLGVVGFYQCYFWDFANKAAPMCQLLKKDEEFKWTKACNKSWEWMKTYDMFASVNGAKLKF